MRCLGPNPVSVSVNYSGLKADADYVGVQEQSGIFAGEGGFDVEVGGHTHLEGSAIVSSAEATDNRFSTETLSYNALRNHAEYDIESKSIGFSTGLSAGLLNDPTQALKGGELPGGISGGYAQDSDSASNTTYAAISDGDIEVRANPGVSLDELKRSREQAHQVLERIFDEDKVDAIEEQRELTQIFAEEAYIQVGNLYNDIERIEHAIDEAQRQGLSEDIIRDLEQRLEDEKAALPVDKAVAHAIVGGITALLGGGNFIQGAMAAGVNEALAEEIEAALGAGGVANNLAKTLIGGLLGGEQGALISGTADRYNRQLHPTEIELINANAEVFARQQGLCDGENCGRAAIGKAKQILFYTTLSQIDAQYDFLIDDGISQAAASAFLSDLALTHGDSITDGYGRSQRLFDERGNANFTQLAVNAEYVFENKAIYDSLLLHESAPPGFNSTNDVLNWVAKRIGDSSLLTQPDDVKKAVLADLQTAYLQANEDFASAVSAFRDEMDGAKDGVFNPLFLVDVDGQRYDINERSLVNVSDETSDEMLKARYELTMLREAMDEAYKLVRYDLTEEEKHGVFQVVVDKTSQYELEALASAGLGVGLLKALTRYGYESKSDNSQVADAPGVVPNSLTGKLSDEAVGIITSAASKGELRRMAALSRASVDELEIVSESFTNIPGSVKNFKGVRRLDDDFFVINDPIAFINKVEDLYAESGTVLNPITRARILDYIGDGSRRFSTQAGIPGLHAEVRSVNSILNQVPSGFDLRKINVSTIKLAPGAGQGLPFPACTNCGEILSNTVNILTGVK